MFQVRTEPIPVDLKADIVVNWLYKHRKIEFEEASKELNVQQVKNAIYEFKTIRHIKKNERNRFNLMRRKLNVQHIISLQKFTEDHLDPGFTLAEVKNHLLYNFQDLTGVSLFSINQLLKKQLKFNYKNSAWIIL